MIRLALLGASAGAALVLAGRRRRRARLVEHDIAHIVGTAVARLQRDTDRAPHGPDAVAAAIDALRVELGKLVAENRALRLGLHGGAA